MSEGKREPRGMGMVADKEIVDGTEERYDVLEPQQNLERSKAEILEGIENARNYTEWAIKELKDLMNKGVPFFHNKSVVDVGGEFNGYGTTKKRVDFNQDGFVEIAEETRNNKWVGSPSDCVVRDRYKWDAPKNFVLISSFETNKGAGFKSTRIQYQEGGQSVFDLTCPDEPTDISCNGMIDVTDEEWKWEEERTKLLSGLVSEIESIKGEEMERKEQEIVKPENRVSVKDRKYREGSLTYRAKKSVVNLFEVAKEVALEQIKEAGGVVIIGKIERKDKGDYTKTVYSPDFEVIPTPVSMDYATGRQTNHLPAVKDDMGSDEVVVYAANYSKKYININGGHWYGHDREVNVEI